MARHLTLCVAATMALLVSGCDDAPPLPGPGDDGAVSEPVEFAESPQQKANRLAVQQARDTVGQLIAALQTPSDKPRIIEVRVLAQDETTGISEQLALRDVTYSDNMLHGKIDSDPLQLTNYKADQTYSVAPEEIYDWYIIEGDLTQGRTLRGGYTLRLRRDSMSPADRQAYDELLGVKFE